MSSLYGNFYGYVYTITHPDTSDVYVGRSTNTANVDEDFGESASLNDDINSLGQERFPKRLMGFANNEEELRKMWNRLFELLEPHYNNLDGDMLLEVKADKEDTKNEAGINNKDTLDKALKKKDVTPMKKVAKKRTRRTKSKVVEELEQLKKDRE